MDMLALLGDNVGWISLGGLLVLGVLQVLGIGSKPKRDSKGRFLK